MRLGIHASVRNGIPAALSEAAALGCRAVQIFPHRPGAVFRLPSPEEAAAIARLRRELSIDYLAVHSVYQPNIASSREKIFARSLDSFFEELSLAAAIGAECLVIHSGSYSPDSDLQAGLDRGARAVREALARVPGKTKVVIENVAGGDRRIGGRFEEIRGLLDRIGNEARTGLCLDSAHTFAAGYPVKTAAELEDTIAEFDRRVGLRFLDLFHLNDSGAGPGSHRDIHAHIGKGWIGAEALRRWVAHPRFRDTPGILETPKLPAGSDRLNLAELRG